MCEDASPEIADAAAFEAYVAQKWRWLLRAGWLLCGDWTSAEDLAQATLARVWDAWARVQTADEPDAYVRRMLTNEYLGRRRRRSSTEVPTDRIPDASTPDTSADVDRQLAVAGALAGLPPRQRAAVVLRYFDDLTLDQTAAALGCSLGTAKSTTSRALRALRGSAELAPYLRPSDDSETRTR